LVSLEVDGVTCRYGSIQVLDSLRFSAKEGEFIGILGPNGSGKTTLLRTISRTLKPHGGAVLLDGRDVYEMATKEVAKRVAIVPQDPAVAFNFTALDVVLMGRNPHLSMFQLESSRDLLIAREAMELTGTWHLADRPIAEVSGGERQHIIIARALAQKPSVLLLDEPTLHLDVNSQIEILDLLASLCSDKQLLVIAVLHDFNLSARYCNKIILLHNRRIVSFGEPENVLTKENMSNVFRVEALVKHQPITDSLYVIPLLRPVSEEVRRQNFRVHLICGGGSGISLMTKLVRAGWSVTAGVLNILDTDHEAAQTLSVATVSEAPFSPITTEAHEENLRLIQEADAVIVTDFLIGHGNLKNLEAAKVALEKEIPTILVDNMPIEQRDFADGEAQRLFKQLIAKGAIIVRNHGEAMRTVESLRNGRFSRGQGRQ